MTGPKILIAWEAGANFGHASKIAEIVKAIGSRADVTLAVRDPVTLRMIAPDMSVRLLPCPIAPFRADEPPGWSYSDNLRQLGYVSAEAIAALIESWRALYTLTQPDVIISEAAPTALLAARGIGVKVLRMGTGYEIPPACDPMPPFLHWSGENAERAEMGEKRVLSYINDALPRFGVAPLPNIAAMLEADETALTTIRELDQYSPSLRDDNAEYLGVLSTTGSGAEVSWRGHGRRVFAYLRSGNPGANAMIEALGSLGNELDIILASPGLEAATAEKVASQGVQHIDGAVRLDGLLDQCALCINHASIGTCAAFLMAGVPQIGLPSQIEQMMLAHALAKSGAGIGLNGKASVVEMRGIVLQALDASQMREAARRIQEKYRGSLQTNVADVVALRALALTR